jgi:hypothetical protein
MLYRPAQRWPGIEPQGGPNDMTVSVDRPGGSALLV